MGLHLSSSDLLEYVSKDALHEAACDMLGFDPMEIRDQLKLALIPLSDSLRKDGKIKEAVDIEDILELCR